MNHPKTDPTKTSSYIWTKPWQVGLAAFVCVMVVSGFLLKGLEVRLRWDFVDHPDAPANGPKVDRLIAVGFFISFSSALAISWFAARGRRAQLEAIEGERLLGERNVREQMLLAESAAKRRLSEETFRNVFVNSGIGMALADPEGRFLKVNPVFASITGYSVEELLGKHFKDITHPDDIGSDLAFVEDLLSSRRQSFEMDKRYLHKDGSPVWVRLTVSLIRDLDGRPVQFIGQVQEIGDLKAAEQFQRRHMETLRLFVEHTPAAVAMFDRELRYIAVSRRWIEDYRLEVGDIMGRCHYDVFPEVTEEWREIHQQALRGTPRRSDEEKFVRADGRIDWLKWEVRPWTDEHGRIGGIIMFTEAITERLKAESELRRLTERLSLATSAAGLGIWEVNTRTLELNWDARTRQIFGVQPGEEADLHALWRRRVHPDDFTATLARVEQSVESLKPLSHGYRLLLPDGRIRHVESHAIPVTNSVTGDVSIVGTNIDVTEKTERASRLQQISQRLQIANKAARIGTWDWNLKTNELVWDDLMHELFGTRPGGFGGTYSAFRSVVHPEDLARVEREIAEAVADSKSLSLEFRIIRPDHIVRIIAAYADLVKDEASGQTHLIGVNQDVTEGKMQSQALAEALERLRLATSAGGLGIWDWDMAGEKLYWDQQMHRIYAVEPGEFHNTYEEWSSLIHAEDLAEVVRRSNEAIASGGGFDATFRARTKEGRPIHVATMGQTHRDASGKVVRMIGINRDITVEVAADHAIRESEARFRTVADCAPVLIWMAGPDRNVTFLNSAWLKFTGNPMELETGHGWTRAVHPEDLNRCLEVYSKSFDLKSPFQLEFRLRRRDGQYRWVLDSAVPLFAADGIFLGYIGSSLDITDRHIAEELLQKARGEAESASRAKSEFLAMMGHEIRTPMNGILGFTDLLKESGLNEEQRSYADTIDMAARNLLGLLNNILDFSKIESGRLSLEVSRINLAEMVGEVVELVRPMALEKRLSFDVAYAEGCLADFDSDPYRVRQVLTNLVSNAVKFTQHGGVSLRVSAPDGHIRFEVSDTGIGIAPDKQPALFKEFTQADASITRRFGGTGLGLAICRRLVAMLGGEIGFESAVGDGSVFWFTIPVRTPHLDHKDLAGIPLPETASKS